MMKYPLRKSTESRFCRMLAIACLVLCLHSQRTRAADILLVGGAFTGGTDQAFQDYLTGIGHTLVAPVNRYIETLPAPADIAAADLIIVSRDVSSGDYDGSGIAAQWNSIDKPLLLMSPFLVRGNARWGWVSSNTLNENKAAPTDYNAYPNPNHPFVDGLTTSVFPTTFNDGTTPMTVDWVGTAAQVPAGSTVVSTMTVDGVNDVLGILDIPAGTQLFPDNNGTATVVSQRRVFFQMNEYPDRGGVFTLSDNGETILNNIINTLSGTSIIPGDVTGDGQVNFDDYLVIETNFQKNVGLRTDGDLNNDGIVDFADFRQWKANRSDLGTGEIGKNAIPEPSTAVGALIAVLTMASVRIGCRRVPRASDARTTSM